MKEGTFSHNYYKPCMLYNVHVKPSNTTGHILFVWILKLCNTLQFRTWACKSLCVHFMLYNFFVEVSQLQNFLLSHAKIRLLARLLFMLGRAIFTWKQTGTFSLDLSTYIVLYTLVRRYDHYSSDVEPSFKCFYIVLPGFSLAFWKLLPFLYGAHSHYYLEQ